MNYQGKFSNFLPSHYEINDVTNEKTLHELQMQLMSKQEIKQKYIQLMNDALNILGKDEAIILIKESKLIWEKLST